MSLTDRVGGWGTVSARRSLTSRLASFSATLPSLDLLPWGANLTAVFTWRARTAVHYV